ncbi:hypothetical protein D3C77_391150 [compost metagenome]
MDLNFGEQVTAPVYELWEQEEIDKVLAERDRGLTAAGVRFTPQYWKRTYNLQDGDIIEGPAATGPEFAEATVRPILDQIALDQAIDSLTGEQLQEQAMEALRPVIEALQQGRDEVEVLGLLAETSPDLDAEALQALLARLMFVADVWGRLNAVADQES